MGYFVENLNSSSTIFWIKSIFRSDQLYQGKCIKFRQKFVYLIPWHWSITGFFLSHKNGCVWERIVSIYLIKDLTMKRWSKQRIKEVCLSRLADSTRSAKYKSGCCDLIKIIFFQKDPWFLPKNERTKSVFFS